MSGYDLVTTSTPKAIVHWSLSGKIGINHGGAASNYEVVITKYGLYDFTMVLAADYQKKYVDNGI